MIDDYKQKGRRNRLVETLRQKGIEDPLVIEALKTVPRHYFFPKDFEDRAYEDVAFPISAGQTISQPYTVAYQSQALQIKSGMKVLEIGTGSGYQAAILAAMGAEVYSIERIEKLYRTAAKVLSSIGLKVHCFWGDGSLGLPKKGPFDRIVVTAAAPEKIDELKHQLAPNGIMVAPIGGRDLQKMVRIYRDVENNFHRTDLDHFKFVPLLGANGWNS